jgi:hypothetical protein
MSFDRAVTAALRILEGIEEGTMSTADSCALVHDADPALIYLMFTWLRRRYADNPNADAVIARLLAVIERDPKVANKMKEGQQDSVVEWFEDEHSYQQFARRDFVELIVDKLES